MPARSVLVTLLLLASLCACAHAPATAAASPASTPTAPLPPVSPNPDVAEAMSALSFLEGEWKGEASGFQRDGTRYSVRQTERVGFLLGGEVLLIEGRGFGEDDTTAFNAFGVVSWDARAKRYEMRSYSGGHAGTFILQVTEDGFAWELPAGPEAKMRFSATVRDGRWSQVGELHAPGREPLRTFEMELRRTGDTDWPAAQPPRPLPPAR